jgi:hypothetical protein
MHSYHRARGKILFEVLCALSLAASFAGAWDQTGSSALLASAAILALFAIYWSFGIFRRDRAEPAVLPVAAVADARAVAVEIAAREEVSACEPEVPTADRLEVFPFQPDVPSEPEPVAPAPKKKRVRKTKKAAADAAPAVDQPEPVAMAEPVSHGPPLEPLFEPQPYVRQPRPAFGRKARGPRTLTA